jgi:hypothetical protein
VVVIATVAVLLLLALGGLRALNERSLRLRCQVNLREVGAALQTYCAAHDASLPDCSDANPQFSGSFWPWDMNTNLFNEIVRCGATSNSLYCPANPAMNDLSHREFWRFAHNPLQVISYGMLFNGIGQESPEYWRKNLLGDGVRPPAQTELGFDATVSMNNDYIHIRGLNVDRSNHVRGKKPLGGNVLLEDGHVEWRDFKQMQLRIQTWPPASWYF